jgi:hypothetical protein
LELLTTVGAAWICAQDLVLELLTTVGAAWIRAQDLGGVWICAKDTVAAVCSRSVVRLTALRFFFRGLGVLVRVLAVLEFFFRGLGILVRVLEVLEFFVPTVSCIRMSPSPEFWRLASEIELGKMALNIKDPELTMVVEDEHRFLIPNSISGPQILQNT